MAVSKRHILEKTVVTTPGHWVHLTFSLNDKTNNLSLTCFPRGKKGGGWTWNVGLHLCWGTVTVWLRVGVYSDAASWPLCKGINGTVSLADWMWEEWTVVHTVTCCIVCLAWLFYSVSSFANAQSSPSFWATMTKIYLKTITQVEQLPLTFSRAYHNIVKSQ